jgi:phosphoribosyl-AMP cyclohydrolase / phosphoribosyl-ATP pyrophosphohydrolase
MTTGIPLPEGIAFGADGLVPVVVQDRVSGDVLMVAWANEQALRLTAETGLAHFWSRSRRALWLKGETSGHRLHVHTLRLDCDHATVLLLVSPEGPACHEGTRTCFGEDPATAVGVLGELERVIAQRARERPEGSYTAKLMAKGLDHALKKVGEEATELVLAAKGETDDRVAEEAADLLFHTLVVLAQRGVALADVLGVLDRRRKR